MKELFGIPTSTIAIVTFGLFLVAMFSVLGVAVSNRMMFRMGLRNIPRRGTQTILVVLGLMLSTLIITAAFTTGDTVNYSIGKQTYDLYGRSDLSLNYGGPSSRGDFGVPGVQPYADQAIVPAIERQFQDDPDIAGVLPFLFEQAPVLNPRTNLSEPAVVLAGIDPTLLAEFGGLTLTSGGKADLAGLAENQVLVSKRAAGRLGAKAGDTLTIVVDGRTHTVEVAGVVQNTLASGVRGFGDPLVLPGIAVPLATLQRITGHEGQVNTVTIALTGSVRGSVSRSDVAAARLQDWLDSAEGQQVVSPLVNGAAVSVETSKQESIDNAEELSNLFTTFFLVLGLFSVAAGIMLIFMIFVMLAAERKPEMGMARAVGAQRGNLVQAFLSEGMAYSVLAGALGAALGVGAAAGCVVGLMRLAGGDAFSFVTAHFTLTSIVIGYTLGVVITFITVVISALRVSHLNIVAAIRGIDEERVRETRRRTSWPWVALGVVGLVVPPLGLWMLLRRGFGLPRAWVWGPLGIVAGVLLMLLGKSSDLLFFFALGISLLPLSLAALAGYYHAPRRLTWSLVGVLLAAYWLMPSSLHDRLFGTFTSDIEMFVLSGVMIVIAFTLLIVFNARLLTSLFERSSTAGHTLRHYRNAIGLGAATVVLAAGGLALGDTGDGLGAISYVIAGVLGAGTLVALAAAHLPRLAPAMKMAVAYPLANRFRTGMTIAMFSLIIFSLTVFSVINANFDAILSDPDANGGIAIVTTANPGSELGDLPAHLTQAGAPVASDIAAAGRVTVYSGSQEVRQPGLDAEWQAYPVLAAGEAFLTGVKPTLSSFANGYSDQDAVLAAVAGQPGLALVDAFPVDANAFGVYEWRTKGVTISHDRFDPFQVEVRDPRNGASTTLTVIGVMSAQIDSRIFGGIYTNASTWSSVYGTPRYERAYVTLNAGVDEAQAAIEIRSALVEQGVQARSIQEMLDEAGAENRVFTRMFQSFMGLGLFVGIAALGVIAFRSVTERRQQIGMLRAIGYQSGDVSLTFLLESSFVALMGILSGVVGAVILSRNLLNSDEFATTGMSSFVIPWVEVLSFVAIAFVFSLLMTWWPSRGASRIQIAEALRYE